MKKRESKRLGLSVLGVLCTLLCSCADTQYYTYSGSRVCQGAGGAARSIDGIDFWIEGSPAKRFQVIGVITDDRRGSRIAMALRNGVIAKLAKQNGGDAVMLARDNSEVVGSISSVSNSGYGSSYTTAEATVTPYPNYITANGSAMTTGSYNSSGIGISRVLTERHAKYYVLKYVQ
jgi:hypothetical protein